MQNQSLELAPHLAQMERQLQRIVEDHMEELLGVKLLAHEYHTGRPQRGSIDSLGLDENNCPVIIEYKRFNNVNIICQGLYYLDWLMTHKAEFRALVKEKFGGNVFESIEFDGARLICMASAFSKYDEYAIMQINRSIELVRYRFFADNLFMLETLNTSIQTFLNEAATASEKTDKDNGVGMPVTLQERIRGMNQNVEELYLDTLTFAQNLGEDVNVRFLKHYIALSRMKNFACIQPMKSVLKIWLNLDPGEIALENGFSRDVTNVGHHASGNLEVEIRDVETFNKALLLLELAYQQN